MRLLFIPLLVLSLSGYAQTESYESLLRRGVEAMHGDSLQLADSLFRRAMQIDPSQDANDLLYRYLGHIMEQQGKQSEALQHYNQGVALHPLDYELRLDRAALLYRMGHSDRALSDYDEILKAAPTNIEALQMRAHIRASMREYRLARQDYDAILLIDPLNERAYIGLVLLNDRTGRPREAMEQINTLIAIYPNHALPYAVRGGIHQRRKQYEQALPDLNRAVELEPENPDFRVSRATLFLDMGKRRQARQDALAAVRLGADPIEMASLLKKE